MSRAPYADAGAAQRGALDRLAAIEVTSKTHLKYALIVSDVIGRVGSYSKLSDQVRRRQLAERFRVSDDTVTRALKWAADHGVISWGPGKPGQQWVLGLIPTPQLKPQHADFAEGGSPHGKAEVAATTEKKYPRRKDTPLPPAPTAPAEPVAAEGRINQQMEIHWPALTAKQRATITAGAVPLLTSFTIDQVLTLLTCDKRDVRTPYGALKTRLKNPRYWTTRSTVGGAPSPREAFADGARIIDWAGAAA